MGGKAVADKLDEARALIERGWTQGNYKIGDCYCVYGAIQQAVRGDAFDDGSGDDIRTLENFVGGAAGVAAFWLASWNDHPERTQAEVVEAFRKAAELAREQSA